MQGTRTRRCEGGVGGRIGERSEAVKSLSPGRAHARWRDGERSRRCPQACDRTASKRFTDLARFVSHGRPFRATVAIARRPTRPDFVANWQHFLRVGCRPNDDRNDAKRCGQRKMTRTPHPSARDGSGIPHFSAITTQLRPWVQGVKIGPHFNRFRQAMDLYDRREYDKAIKELTKINRLDPTFVPAYQGRAMPWRTTLALLSNSF